MKKSKNIQKTFKNNKQKYYLGLDLGITSVGWAVMAENSKNKENYLHDFGVRIFDSPAIIKDKQAKVRRTLRSQRRGLRRRGYRINKLKKILQNLNLYEGELEKQITNKILYKNKEYTTENEYWNPFVLKNKGLKEKLNKQEIWSVLLHTCKTRGYDDKSLLLESEESENKNQGDLFYEIWTEDPQLENKKNWNFINQNEKNLKKWTSMIAKFKKNKHKASISKAERLMKNYKTISECILKEKDFWIDKDFQKNKKNEKYFLIHSRNTIKDAKHKDKRKEIEETKNNYRFLFSREEYKKELKQILEKQKHYYSEKLNTKRIEEIINTIFQQRNFEIGAKCKEHNFQSEEKCQRKNKSCSSYPVFSETAGHCAFFSEEKRGYKCSLIFSVYYFVGEIMKFFSVLEDTKVFFSNKERFELVKKYLKTEINKRDLKTYLKNTDTWKQNEKLNLNQYFQGGMWKENNKKAGFSINKDFFLKKIRGLNFFEKWWNDLNESNIEEKIENNVINKIGSVLNKTKTRNVRWSRMQEILKKNDQNYKNEDWMALKNLGSKYTVGANVSFKYMLNFIKDFFQGKNPLKNNQHNLIKIKMNEKNIGKKEGKIFNKIIDWDIEKNPSVFRSINQVRKTLKALYRVYGSFENITLETSKDFGKTFASRGKLIKQMNENEQKTEEIIKTLEKKGIEANKTRITKYKLWQQQNEEDVYCGKKLYFDEIFSFKSEKPEIDHIIPRSKVTFNDFNNKVLVCYDCNQEKGNRMPLNFLTGERGEEFLIRIGKLKSENKINNQKYEYLKIIDLNDEILRKLQSSGINNTKYINKWILAYIKQQLRNHNQRDTDVLSINGKITSILRKNWLFDSPWGLKKDKIRNVTHFHHAVDAIVLSQIKGFWNAELMIDSINLWRLKKNWENENHPFWKNKKEEEFKETFKNVKLKWNKRYIYGLKVGDYSLDISERMKKNQLAEPLIKNLKQEIESRIPVKLLSIKCDKCEALKTKNNKVCFNCDNRRKIVNEGEALSEKLWAEGIKKLKYKKEDLEKINLKYPLVSYMTNYKIGKKWSDSQQFGFILSTGKKMAKFKQKFYKIWMFDKKLEKEKNRNYILLLEEEIKKQKNEKKENKKKNTLNYWNKWKKDFEQNEKDIKQNEFKSSFIFVKNKNDISGTGKVISTRVFYGIHMPLDQNKTIMPVRQIEMIRKAKRSKNVLYKKKELLVKGVSFRYYDKTQNQYLIKTYYNRKEEKLIRVCPNQLKINQEKHKENPKNIRNKFKILNVDLLGNFN